MASVISGDANVSATEFGFLDGVTAGLQTQLDAKLALAGGKILQIVRATDSIDRSTTSTSVVDASISVTITPTKSTSAVLLVWSARAFASGGGSANYFGMVIADSSNNVISGAQDQVAGVATSSDSRLAFTILAYATPATTSATTYKGRFRSASTGTTCELQNANNAGQLFAIEVSA